jgi:hypothetical protein
MPKPWSSMLGPPNKSSTRLLLGPEASTTLGLPTPSTSTDSILPAVYIPTLHLSVNFETHGMDQAYLKRQMPEAMGATSCSVGHHRYKEV